MVEGHGWQRRPKERKIDGSDFIRVDLFRGCDRTDWRMVDLSRLH